MSGSTGNQGVSGRNHRATSPLSVPGYGRRSFGKTSFMEKLLAKFKLATDVLEDHDIDYLVFGGIAVWAYGRRRETSDIDILIKQADAKRTLEALGKTGFGTEETDDKWLYKASIDHCYIDLIFKAKGEIKLTPEILSRQRQQEIGGFAFRIIDPENLVMMKILASKEIRPADWYDALSILQDVKPFDWDYFISKAFTYVTKALSFLFFAEATNREKTGLSLIPSFAINELFAAYERGQANSSIS